MAPVIDLLSSLTSDDSELVIAAPGAGEGFWAGGPSAVHRNGTTWLAYRLRKPVDQGRGFANVIAKAADGKPFETVAMVTSDEFECASLERPALVRRPDGGWRLYVSCSTPNSKHWWVEAIDADRPSELGTGKRTVVLPGDDTEAWKDVVVQTAPDGTWRMWACRHPLDGGDNAADRMSTWYATSDDGLHWELKAEALKPVAETWCARGTRVADVVAVDGHWWMIFDGRRSAEENWRERSGLAVGDRPDRFSVVAGPVPTHAGRALRYASVVERSDGYQVYFEATGPDGSHDLRRVYVPRPSELSQSE